MKGERRLRTLVGVQILLAEAVAATAGREVVQRSIEPVAAEEPIEGALGAGAVLGLAGDDERRELRLDQGRCIERLLVAASRSGVAAKTPAGLPSLDEQVLFSSGWEWGYWQNDYVTLRQGYTRAARWQLPGLLAGQASVFICG